ncbi:MAG: rhodanese-like domain-containing protein [Candidatus Pelagibacter sp.]|jgi:rhodanese-related sulfurtransferase|nr:rhodanese-like domain-containing protein [Candidatus Pelagibacter sp.]
MKIKTIKSLVDEAMQVVTTIEPKEAKTLLELDNHLLIDIRDIRELWKSGTIKGARHIPRGMLEFWLDPESPYFKSDLKVEMVKILYCASNWRSALASKALMEMGFTNVMHIQGGFQSLVDAGFSVQKVEPK